MPLISCSLLSAAKVRLIKVDSGSTNFASGSSNKRHIDQIHIKLIRYKTVNTSELKLHVIEPHQKPEGARPKESLPAVVFFHGGGWNNGHPDQFYRHGHFFAQQGYVAISVEYRLRDLHQSSPKDSVMDARSAMRFIKKNRQNLNINPDHIIVAGGSAGGHLALATALIQFDDPNDDLSVDPTPMAIAIFNPIIDTSKDGWGHSRVKTYWREFSPLHQISDNLPPTLIMLGTEDNLVPVTTAKAFQKSCLLHNVDCQLILYEGEKHGFFNNEKFQQTLLDMAKFVEQQTNRLNDNGDRNSWVTKQKLE